MCVTCVCSVVNIYISASWATHLANLASITDDVWLLWSRHFFKTWLAYWSWFRPSYVGLTLIPNLVNLHDIIYQNELLVQSRSIPKCVKSIQNADKIVRTSYEYVLVQSVQSHFHPTHCIPIRDWDFAVTEASAGAFSTAELRATMQVFNGIIRKDWDFMGVLSINGTLWLWLTVCHGKSTHL